MTRAALLVSAALCAAPMAHAQTVTNNQYQLRGVTSETTIVVGEADDAAATAIASGNAASTAHEGENVVVENNQHMDGDTTANADATVWRADGGVATNATAIANGATTSATDGDQDVTSDQRAHGNAEANATFTGGDALHASTSASASGNVLAASQTNGQARVIASQESTGAISASVEADHCCVADVVAAAGIASANNASIGGETATVLADIRQRDEGESVSARVDLYAGYATDASANATANANSATVDNQWGYVNARIEQSATSNVRADSYVTLGGDFLGIGSAGAYGVGNQAIVANVGSDTVLDVIQANAGDISANAALSGEGGEAALVSAAAYGNSVTGSLCSYCDEGNPTLTAGNNQTNDGDVRANATLLAPRAGLAAATSTAIGNAATFQNVGRQD